MKPRAPTSRWLGAGLGRLGLWLTACCCCGASAQMLAPSPNPEASDAPAPERRVAVRTVPVPGGLMLERADVPPEPAPAALAARGDQGQEQRARYRTISMPNGTKMLEATDAAPAPEAEAIDPGRLVERTNEAGQSAWVLRDETPPKQNPGPLRWVRDIPADARGAAMPSNPEPDVLYRVVKPGGGS